MKLIYITQEQLINWNKPQWVVGKQGELVLTTGSHKVDYFKGTMLPHETYLMGEHLTEWRKDYFIPLQGSHQITISNED